VLAGDVAFRLYDTYGFPLDLVQDALREEGLKLDIPGYEAQMQVQRETSRAAWTGGAAGEIPAVYQELAEEPPTEFLGYKTLERRQRHPISYQKRRAGGPGPGRGGSGDYHRGHPFLRRGRRPGGGHGGYLRGGLP
jgi:alanyl-tRNA synthetase